MIIEALLALLHGLAQGLASFLSAVLPPAPGIWADFGEAFAEVFDIIPAPVLHFVPIVPIVGLATTVIAVVVAFGAVRFARRILSLFTGGGGNA